MGHFSEERLGDAGTLAIARCFTAEDSATTDPSAFVPQWLTAKLLDGSFRTVRIDALPGSPQRPLDRTEQHAKVRCCLSAVYGESDRVDALARAIERLPQSTNAASLLDPVTGA